MIKKSPSEKETAKELRLGLAELQNENFEHIENKNLENFEMISKFENNQEPENKETETDEAYVSPLMTMNEDEILAFVEEFSVAELATLSVAELNRIGEVLGVAPSILVNMKD